LKLDLIPAKYQPFASFQSISKSPVQCWSVCLWQVYYLDSNQQELI